MDGLKADPGGAPVSTAPFSELSSELEAIPWAGNRSGGGFGAETVSMVSWYI